MKKEMQAIEEIADELAIRLGDANRQTYEERLKLCRQYLPLFLTNVK